MKKHFIRPIKVTLKHYTRRADGAHGVVATTKFAGSPVVAHAVCDPNDVYDEARGDELVTARLEVAVAGRRVALRRQDVNDLKRELDFLNKMYEDACEALDNALNVQSDALSRLVSIENSFR